MSTPNRARRPSARANTVRPDWYGWTNAGTCRDDRTENFAPLSAVMFVGLWPHGLLPVRQAAAGEGREYRNGQLCNGMNSNDAAYFSVARDRAVSHQSLANRIRYVAQIAVRRIAADVVMRLPGG